MNKLIKRTILAILTSALVILGGTMQAVAADQNADELVFSITKPTSSTVNVGVLQGTRNFHFNNVIPGDSMQQVVKVRNDTTQKVNMELRISIQSGVDEKELWVQLAKLIRANVVDSKGNQFQTNLLGEGSTVGTGGITQPRTSVELAAGETYTMTMNYSVPEKSVDNTFAGLTVDPSKGFTWDLKVDLLGDDGNPTPTDPGSSTPSLPGGTTDRPGGTGSNQRDTDRTRTTGGGSNIPDEQVPTDQGYVPIGDGQTPKDPLPKTGSSSRLIVTAGIFIGALVVSARPVTYHD